MMSTINCMTRYVLFSGAIMLGLFHPLGAIAATISGKVSAWESQSGIDGVFVYLYDSSWELVTQTTTNVSGQYSLDTSEGYYYLYIYKEGYTAKYYSSVSQAYAYDLATAIYTTAAQAATGIDLTLAVGGSIQGSVTDVQTGEALSEFVVRVYDTNSNVVSWNYTDENGNIILALDPGSYYLQTFDATGYYINQYPDGTASSQEISPQILSSGQQLTGVYFSLVRSDVAVFTEQASYTVGEPVSLYVSLVESITPVDAYLVIASPDGTFKSIKGDFSLSNNYELVPVVSNFTPMDISPALNLLSLDTTGWATGSYGIYVTLAYSGYYPGYSSNQYRVNYNIFSLY
jgi:hypothetical protein